MELRDKLKNCVRKGSFVLSSGKKSNYYVDVKKVSTDPATLREIAREMASLVDEDTDRIGGIAVGAVPLATALSLETGIPLLIIRKEKKGYGTRVTVEGGIESGDRVVIVEDVSTTGASSLAAVEAVRECNATCDKVLVVVDREEGAEDMLKEHGIDLKPLFRVEELIS